MGEQLFQCEKKPLFITDTIFRDAHQSHTATRMRLSDMLPACDVIDRAGYWSVECWGGATFDACIRFLDENPWERLRALRRALPHTKLQMLLRGQNLLGYRHYADDVVDLFCKKSIENGIDVVRIFDALNDTRNLQAAVNSIRKYGGIVEVALCYTTSPVHNEEYFINKAVELEKMGADVICIKDMANILLPNMAYSLVSELKRIIKVPIHLHTHNTTGTGAMVYLAAAQAGVDIIDCALSPFSNGTSQPATESLVATLAGTARDTGMSLKLLNQAADILLKTQDRMRKQGLIRNKMLRVEPKTLLFQVPGGMLSNLLLQLKEAGSEQRLEEVLEEVPRVRKDFGYPPLVTPTSQIVGAQAVLNVLMGRYALFTKESKSLLCGKYGRLPGEINEEVRQKAIGDAESEHCRPADLLESEMGVIREQFGKIAKTEEDLLSCAMFPQIAPRFIKKRDDLVVNKIHVNWIH